MHKDVDIDIGTIILQKLEEKERNVTWLAKKIGCNESNLRKTLNNSRFVYYDLVYKISKALEVDFFAYGSQKL
jgi:plasmid maintenance system antidote protein VapI